MNKKGQTLIIFVIFIPVLITLLAVVVDVGLLTNEVQKTTGVLDIAIQEYFDKGSIEVFQSVLMDNHISTDHLKVAEQEQKVVVEVEYQMDSLFGRLIGMKTYDVIVKRTGFLENGKVIIKKQE